MNVLGRIFHTISPLKKRAFGNNKSGLKTPQIIFLKGVERREKIGQKRHTLSGGLNHFVLGLSDQVTESVRTR